MQEVQQLNLKAHSAQIFAAGFFAFAVLSAIVIGAFPLWSSIITIFIFAGAHNWFEFRYFAARMPIRWGKSRIYYSVGIGGVIVLTICYLLIYFASGNWFWSAENWTIFISIWNTAFVLWVGVLFYLRGRQKPKTDWSLAFAFAFLAAAFVWLSPAFFSLSLVYIHPFVAMWFLERQIRRTRRDWLKAYHLCLLSVPFFLLLLYFVFASTPDLPNETELLRRITQHAGSLILPSISSHFLVASHVFLETVHYTVWILLIPLADKRAVPWRFQEIPFFANKNGFPKIAFTVLAIGIFLVFALWVGFSLNYETTRDIYFAFAIAHVLAEFPFLVKML